MKLREKIESIDNQIEMLKKYMWFVQNKLGFDHIDVIQAANEIDRLDKINNIKEEARKLGLKIG
jgi:hypothetical protein